MTHEPPVIKHSQRLEPRACELRLSGIDLQTMEAEARRQFDQAFAGRNWEIVNVHAHLDMVSIGNTDDEWLPGEWHVTYEAREHA